MTTDKRVIAMGFFDGLHIGHAALLEKAKERAAGYGAMPSVLSFDVHPDQLVFKKNIRLIGDARSREEIIRRCFGINDVVFIHFNRQLMNMPWDEFIESSVEELHICHFVVGHDFTFGRKGEGNVQKLQEYCSGHGIGCDVISAVMLDGRIVSSTYIRTLIENGEMEEAQRYMGRPHSLYGPVRSGYHIGRKLDAPTINLFLPEGVVEPRYGVYAAKVILPDGQEIPAVTNVGIRPTFQEDGRVSVESHLLGFEGNLYGVTVRVDFYHFIRPERKFERFEDLSAQIRADGLAAASYFEQRGLKGND